MCDPDGILATPLETIQRRELSDQQVARRVAELAREWAAIEVVVGEPVHLGGGPGEAARAARELAVVIGRETKLPVRLVDERLTSVQAAGALRAAGRRAKAQRSVIDQAAAVVLLQAALDGERASGRPAGRGLEVDSASETDLTEQGEA
jgi:putative Holliday junction resolvase